jgi:hypothetical protein
MKLTMKLALAFTCFGYFTAVICLIKTTALTMLLFGFLGVGSFFAGFAIYLLAVIKDLRDHGVL